MYQIISRKGDFSTTFGGLKEDTSTKSTWDTPLLNIKEEQKTTPLWSRARMGQI